MTLRDLKVLIDIFKNKIDLGLPVDQSINEEFANKIKHFNFLFATGIDFFYEFFNIQNYYFKFYSNKILKSLNKNKSFKDLFINFAD